MHSPGCSECTGGRVLRMAYLISGNYADSEDIVQETFVKCFTYRACLKDPDNI